MLRWFIPVYRACRKLVRLGGLGSNEQTDLEEAFLVRRTELDLAAVRHRLDLIADNDPRDIAAQTRVPIYAQTGWLDPIVPWSFVRFWLRRHCPALRDYRVIWFSDHTVLNTAAEPAARQILAWMGQGGAFSH